MDEDTDDQLGLGELTRYPGRNGMTKALHAFSDSVARPGGYPLNMAAMAKEDEGHRMQQLEQLPVAQDVLLGNIQTLARRCRHLLHELCSDSDATKHLTSFNIWAATAGAFRQGHQSLVSRLKNSPDISTLTERLLHSLAESLENQLKFVANEAEDDESRNDTDSSSDRSEVPYSRVEDGYKPSGAGQWPSIENKITTLRQIGIGLHHSGEHHRQERVDLFIQQPRNQQVYELCRLYATQRARYVFPGAYKWLHERVGESIALRRSKLMYLELHKIKRLTAFRQTEGEPGNFNQDKPSNVDGTAAQTENVEGTTQKPARRPWQTGVAGSVAQRTKLSQTVVTKLEAPKRSDPVASAKILAEAIPRAPTIDEVNMSFDCPYCFLTCPVTEASTEAQWKNHLIHDLAPFICVNESCNTPFAHAESYSAWRTHIVGSHAEQKWFCWYCEYGATGSQKFSSPLELEEHLQRQHGDTMTSFSRSTLAKNSLVDRLSLHDCPFCGGYPEEIEQRFPLRDSDESAKALAEHIKNHLLLAALILLPAHYEAKSEHEKDGMKSEADQGDDKYKDSQGLEALDERWTVASLQCYNPECDCKWPSSFYSGDWSQFPDTVAVRFTASICYEFDDPAFSLKTKNDEWEFWYPLSLGPNSMRTATAQPSLVDDSKLRVYFGAQLFDEAQLRRDYSDTLGSMGKSASIYKNQGGWETAKERRSTYVEDLRETTAPLAVEALSTYLIVRLQKCEDALKGDSKRAANSWERVMVVTEENMSQSDIITSMHRVTENKENGFEKRQADLPLPIQMQIDRATKNIKNCEADARFDWELAQFEVKLSEISVEATEEPRDKERGRGRAKEKEKDNKSKSKFRSESTGQSKDRRGDRDKKKKSGEEDERAKRSPKSKNKMKLERHAIELYYRRFPKAQQNILRLYKHITASGDAALRMQGNTTGAIPQGRSPSQQYHKHHRQYTQQMLCRPQAQNVPQRRSSAAFFPQSRYISPMPNSAYRSIRFQPFDPLPQVAQPHTEPASYQIRQAPPIPTSTRPPPPSQEPLAWRPRPIIPPPRPPPPPPRLRPRADPSTASCDDYDDDDDTVFTGSDADAILSDADAILSDAETPMGLVSKHHLQTADPIPTAARQHSRSWGSPPREGIRLATVLPRRTGEYRPRNPFERRSPPPPPPPPSQSLHQSGGGNWWRRAQVSLEQDVHVSESVYESGSESDLYSMECNDGLDL